MSHFNYAKQNKSLLYVLFTVQTHKTMNHGVIYMFYEISKQSEISLTHFTENITGLKAKHILNGFSYRIFKQM